ncbi:hypothetical protein SANT12839_060400 [Streptomyces antimycoticus]|uniref:Uncharacterized protein n=1 Tax=Streptomyces antimycoticus TaxID=68175 RepID=A0A4D4KEY9_9ACTN|nr:hypothetical protein SANT12839_060400 [Streptomyces antimycoticus]
MALVLTVGRGVRVLLRVVVPLMRLGGSRTPLWGVLRLPAERLGGDGMPGDQRLRRERRTARVAQPQDRRIAEAGGPRDYAHMSYQSATAPGEVHEHGPLPGHVSAEGTRRRALGHI